MRLSEKQRSGGCFTNVSWALQNNLAKIHNTKNHIYGEYFKLKLCSCAQSMALGTRTKFQLEFRITSTISAIDKFQENTLESLWKVSETTPCLHKWKNQAISENSLYKNANISLTFQQQRVVIPFCIIFITWLIEPSDTYVQGSTYQEIFTRLTSQISHFSTHIISNGLVQDWMSSIANPLQSGTKPSIYNLEDNFAQIHMPGWQFYLPQAVRHWDMSPRKCN